MESQGHLNALVGYGKVYGLSQFVSCETQVIKLIHAFTKHCVPISLTQVDRRQQRLSFHHVRPAMSSVGMRAKNKLRRA